MKRILLMMMAPFMMMAHTPLKEPTSIIIIKKDAKKLAEYYRQRVLRGENMASVAKLYSEDPGSAPNGGQYDGIVKGVMVPEFENVAFSL